jgi:hypothetical protein
MESSNGSTAVKSIFSPTPRFRRAAEQIQFSGVRKLKKKKKTTYLRCNLGPRLVSAGQVFINKEVLQGWDQHGDDHRIAVTMDGAAK